MELLGVRSNPQLLLSVGLYLYGMSKKEKYYNFIVDDMVKKTEIDHDQEKIKFPFYNNSIFFSTLLLILPPLYSPPNLSPIFSRFSKHAIERYGTHDEEMEIIWNLYKEKIQSLIKK